MADPILGPVQDGDTFKLILFQKLYNQTLMNVFHYVCSDPGLVAHDRYQVGKALAESFNTAPDGIGVQMRALQSLNLTHTTYRAQFLKEIDATYPFSELLVNELGEDDEVAGVANIAASIEKRAVFDTGHPREGIGRMQLAGIPKDKYSGGVFSTLYLDDFANLTQDMADDITVLAGVVLSPCLTHKGATNWIDNKIFQCSVKDTVRVMNRRTVGRGE